MEQFIDAGFPCKVVPKLAVQHGIDAARLILPQCTFNADTCYAGIEALRAYRRKYNEKINQYSNTPLHDWSSNGSDAFRMFSLVTETDVQEKQAVKEDVSLVTTPQYTLEALFKDNEKKSYGIIRL